MKKVFLSFGLCMMMVAAFAQQRSGVNAGGPSFYFGGGPTFSKFTGDGGDNASILVGAQVALGSVWQLGNNFSFVPELNVGMQGSKLETPQDNNYRLWYLNLPVQVRYQFAGSGFFAETGPQIGLLVDAKRVIGDNKTDVSDNFKTASLNWNFGVGYNITSNLALNARVTPGISDIDKSSSASTKQFTSALRVLFIF